MNEATITALYRSIEHWRYLSYVRKHNNVHLGPDSCALCNLFNEDFGCVGCPVSKETGLSYCHGTPYENARNAAAQWLCFSTHDGTPDDIKQAAKIFHSEAKIMHKWLVDLLTKVKHDNTY